MDNEEISLIDLFSVLWQRRKMIITVTSIAALGAVVFSILSLMLPPEISPLPNKYTPKALMLIDDKSSSGGGLSSLLNSNNMGGLASLAGLNLMAGSNNSQLAEYLAETNSMLDSVVDSFNMIERYKIKKSPRASSRKKLKKLIKAEYDDKSGVFSVCFTDRDPVFARDVVNYCTVYLEKRFDELGIDKNKIEKENLEININNTFQEIRKLEEESRELERAVSSAAGRLPAITMDTVRITMELEAQREVYTRLKVQYELLKVTMASEKPVFQILEMAEIPDRKAKPNRGLICIIVILTACFFSVFIAFILNSAAKIKNDPEVIKKFKNANEK